MPVAVITLKIGEQLRSTDRSHEFARRLLNAKELTQNDMQDTRVCRDELDRIERAAAGADKDHLHPLLFALLVSHPGALGLADRGMADP